MRIVVTGLVGLYPVGGVAWDYLQYVVGLHRLGHDVYYFEDTWSWPYHPVENSRVEHGHYSAEFIAKFFARYAPELGDHWHYWHLHETFFGMPEARINDVLTSADVFLNVSGANLLPKRLPAHCLKVFLDTDPGYNQIVLSERPAWSEHVDRWSENVAAHDRHFTYAENIHGGDSLVPKLGFAWKTTRMPVVVDLWDSVAARPPPAAAPWSTIMTWNAFRGPLVYQGVEYKSKGPEFERLLDLPARTGRALGVAVGGTTAPMDKLRSHGWQVSDGPAATLTPERYQDFIAGTRGEISTAKNVYVALRTGWFSCRSACFLAAGRPVVVQDTGFARLLPTGEGLLAFSTADEAADAIARVEADYDRHARAARRIAHEQFGAAAVLTRLLEDAAAG